MAWGVGRGALDGVAWRGAWDGVAWRGAAWWWWRWPTPISSRLAAHFLLSSACRPAIFASIASFVMGAPAGAGAAAGAADALLAICQLFSRRVANDVANRDMATADGVRCAVPAGQNKQQA